MVEERERVPDVVVYKDSDFRPGNDETKVKQMPLIAIEILSPSQSLTDLIAESHQYFEAGVQSYWLIIPDPMTV